MDLYSTIMNKILDYLEQLGLSEIEAKLYLTLLNTGPISVRELAETTKIKRTTAYLYIDQLIDKELVMKLVKGSKKLVVANEPAENLHYLVDKKLERAKKAEANLPEMVSLLTKALPQKESTNEAEIRYYKGKSGVKKIYEDALKAKELRTYVNFLELTKLLVPNGIELDINLFDRGLKKNPNLRIFEIVANTPNVIQEFNLDLTGKNQRYRYKFMPNTVGLTSPGILLYDNTVAIINGNGKLTSIVLRNTEYYVNSKKLFDFMWSMLPEIK